MYKVLIIAVVFFFSVFGNAFAQLNYGLEFNGTSTDFVNLGDGLILEGDFVIDFTFQTDILHAGAFINRIDEGGVYDVFWDIGLNSSNGNIVAEMGDGVLFSQIFTSTSRSYADDILHRVVWTKTGDTQTLFVDGIDETIINFIDLGIDSGINSTTTNVYFGGDVESNDFFYDGILGSVQIDTDGVCIGLWNFDENGSPISDTCGGNPDVVVSGFLFILLTAISIVTGSVGGILSGLLSGFVALFTSGIPIVLAFVASFLVLAMLLAIGRRFFRL